MKFPRPLLPKDLILGSCASLPLEGRDRGWGSLGDTPDYPPPQPSPSRGEGAKRAHGWKQSFTALAVALSLTAPTLAIDPPYQRQMERLAEIMGSLYYLQPLCEAGDEDWREQMSELIALDEPDDDRRQRLAGAFNGGYTAFARFHKQCTPASREALTRLLGEAQKLARDIHTRFAE
ncbi:TIGR02301 family protein [Devosia rhizoryzae]|uniref:TIGR02301 family protein n=1 Tax=Devosia rhizoryzae TaxID=2774137 RepID=A0ABX7C214_9HYPH|nr:TIGR02301 family protein [Devosia rhizoryzae]QQR38106.1 TIGR02301 family protein [Devosia rhizoryzae]